MSFDDGDDMKILALILKKDDVVAEDYAAQFRQ